MNSRLGDIIRFRDDKLFQGAVDISWFSRDRNKSQAAAASFVFHGPRYHGVRQEGYHEHKLTDTATFACSILTQACGKGEQPFKMAVAGYGTGKSHLSLALAELLHAPESGAGQAVLEGINSADKDLGQECRILLNEQSKPSLVITLNGMREFPLMSEITHRVIEVLHADGNDTSPIENVRPRFARAARLMETLNQQLTDEICQEAGYLNLESLVFALKEEQNETAYKAVAQYLEKAGLSLDASQNGSLPNLFQILEENYCGLGSPYKSIVIIFDEFGKYLEFALSKPYIAGSTALQELYEAVQSSSNHVCFIGFIQYELSAYLERLNAEYLSEAKRYISRYDSAEKVYLSTNIETLIANIIEKKNLEYIEKHFLNSEKNLIENTQFYLNHFFEKSKNSYTWNNKNIFYRVICQGCWPLSPFALWFIYDLASGGRQLQGRSALLLLKELFSNLADTPLDALPSKGIPATSLLNASLKEELINSERDGRQGAIANAFETVLNRHRDRLNESSLTILKAIVIAAKLIMKADSRDDAIQGISLLSGISVDVVKKELQNLQFELNLVDWNEALFCFDILSDAIPKTQFLNFLHQRRLNEYDISKQSKLFPSTIDRLTDLLSAEIETNFGESHNIKTREWRFIPKKTNLNFINPILNETLAEWLQRTEYDEAKGTTIFCYVGQDIGLEEILSMLRKELRSSLKQKQLQSAPVFIVLLYDADNKLGTILAEYDILQKLSKAEKEKFTNLIPSHEEYLRKHAEKIVYELIKQRYWVSPLGGEQHRRLTSVGNELFETIYKDALPFSMDGFATTSGNGRTTAYSFAQQLFYNNLSFDDIQSMATREKNRAIALFKNDWNIFSSSGKIQKNPAILQKFFRQWDTKCQEGLSVSDIFTNLTKPPFGMNNMSALLLIGVYVASRYDNIHIITDENPLSARQWADLLFSGKRKQITPQFFKAARIFISEGNTEKWSEFLDEWESCLTYEDLCTFPERAKDLKKQYPITKAEDIELYLRLEQKSESARKEISKFSKLEDKAESQLEEAERKGRTDLLLFCTANFAKLLTIVESAPECWPAEYGPKFERRFGQMRQELIARLPEWLESLAPSTDTPEAIATFKGRMEDYRGKLIAIKLEEDANQLKSITQKACHNVEVLATYRAKMRDVQNWLEQHIKIPSDLGIGSLRNEQSLAKDFAKALSTIARNKPLEGLSDLRERLSEHQKNLEVRIKSLHRRMSEVLNPSLQSLTDIEELHSELSKLEKLFSGQDAQDLADLKNTLSWTLSSWKTLCSDNSLDSDLLAKRLDSFQDELNQRIDDYELGLDAAAIYSMLATDIEEDRKKRSALWLEGAIRKCGHIPDLSTDEATSRYSWLQGPPVYLTEEDRKGVAQLRDQLEKHLAKQKIAWLLEEFGKLPKEQQKEFFDRLKTLIAG